MDRDASCTFCIGADRVGISDGQEVANCFAPSYRQKSTCMNTAAGVPSDVAMADRGERDRSDKGLGQPADVRQLIQAWVREAARAYPLRVAMLLVFSVLASIMDGLSISMLIPLIGFLFPGSSLVQDDDSLLPRLLTR